MAKQTGKNIVPLTEAVLAHRDRLVQRVQKMDVIDADAVCHLNLIERWLSDFEPETDQPPSKGSGARLPDG